MIKYLLDHELSRLLGELGAPIDSTTFTQRCAQHGLHPDTAGQVWAVLVDAGLLRPVSATEQPTNLASTFAGWRSQRGMLADMARTQQLRNAIEVQVRPGDRVADVGSGSGILSLFAARAGAERVHALETTALIEDAQRIAQANGLADRIDFVRGDAAAFSCDAPLDLVMGEWAGIWLFEEWRHFDAFAAVRDRCLKPDGQVLPSRARAYLSPVDDSRLYVERGPGWWERPVWGFDFSLVHREQWDRTRRIVVQADRRSLLQPLQLVDVDCRRDNSSAYFFSRSFEVPFSHACSCHGFVGWFVLDLAPGVVIDTSPRSIDTSWHQSYFPMEQLHIQPGDRLQIEVRTVPDAVTGSPVLELLTRQQRGEACIATREHRYTLDDTQG